MGRIMSVHSFRGGTGKSNTTANLAAFLALRGLRIGVVDTDIMSPGIHVLFGWMRIILLIRSMIISGVTAKLKNAR